MADVQRQEDSANADGGAEDQLYCETPDTPPLSAVLAMDEFFSRPQRAADHALESAALRRLARALASSPQSLLQEVTEIALDVFEAGSAGISLLSKDEQRFEWPAIAGRWKPHIGGGTPRHFGPCGDVLDRSSALFFQNPELRYTYLSKAVVAVTECLLVPFYVSGKAVGTVWIVAHDELRKFDTEDLRVLESICEFTSAAYQIIETQSELKKSEERFRVFATSGSDVVYRMNHDWTELYHLTGRNFIKDTVQPTGNWLHEYVDPIDHEHVMKVVEEGLRTRQVMEIESRVRRVDGEIAWSYSRAVPVLDSSGAVVEWIGSGRDITERRKTEDALRKSEERYRTLFNSMDEGYCIIDVIFDEKGKPVDYRFIEVNPAFERATGLKDATGMLMREIAPSHEQYWFDIYGKVASTGEAVRFINKAAALDRWFDLFAFKVGGEQSRHVAVLFQDITQQKKTEDALQASETLYRGLFNSMDEGFAIVEVIFNDRNIAVDYVFLEVNPAFEKHTGITASVIGMHVRELMPDAEELWYVIIGQAAITGEPTRIEAEAKAINRWFNLQAFKIGDADSRKVAVIFTDITERRDTERKLLLQARELAELNRRKNEFIAMLSHELRNPLAPLANAVQLMQLQQGDAELQRQARDIIERQVSQLKHLIDDLLEISRITTGRVLLRLEQTTANSVLEHALETTRPLIAQRNQELTVKLPSRTVWLRADAARLEQVIVNLLTNASKFTDEGGRIDVELEQDGSSAVLRVRDNGIGISPEQLPHIFDLFTQAERSLDRAQGGLGIGLSLVRQLIELHGGTVDATSTLGQGSEFVVRLDCIDETQVQQLQNTRSESEPANKTFRILVVDDNVDAAHTLSMLLQMMGHDTQITFDGETAVDASIEFMPDVVLLDIGLPELDGYAAAKLIRQQPGLENVVLIALTGYGRDMDRAMTQAAGFDHHLVKPADFNHLLKILATLGEQSGATTGAELMRDV